MFDGFIKTAAATPKIRVADCEYNADAIIALMNEARDKGVNILVFPELCVTGYTCHDLFYQRTLLDGAVKALERIVKASGGSDMLVTVGCPLVFEEKLFNCAVVFQNGEILGIVPKKYLPNYNEFYEMRQFTPAPDDSFCSVSLNGKAYPFGSIIFECADIPELKFAVEICEDLWAAEPPSIKLAKAGATIIANLSASNETIGKDAYRRELVSGQSARLMCGYVYASAGDGESTQDLVFGGHRMIAENGAMLAESELFTTGLTISEIDVHKMTLERRRNTSFRVEDGEVFRVPFKMQPRETALTRKIEPKPFVPSHEDEKAKRCRDILTMQAHGLSKRIEHTNCKTIVIGISGGLDSCLALLVCVEAMKLLNRPMSDIITVTMPCFGTTKRTKSNAEKLCAILGTDLRVIDISDSVRQHFKDIGHDENDHSVTYENGQARERTQVLMDIANKDGGMVIGTGDLSELALGWATYNGDHMSMYGVNSSVPKTLVRHIVYFYADTCGNDELKRVLLDIFNTPVSPELIPPENGEISQITEDLVGPYELHDFFLYNGIRWAFPPKKVFRLAKAAFAGEFDGQTILKWLKTFYRRFFSQQFKRSCLPDGVKVGSVTLSPRGDWRMPSDAQAALWLKELDEIQI
ncbi:MAG: NAD(+) synthase [Oscillospiraceae bacterium]|nr:NAD(+) synthase [Oscillospiraceae bacterium]